VLALNDVIHAKEVIKGREKSQNGVLLDPMQARGRVIKSDRDLEVNFVQEAARLYSFRFSILFLRRVLLVFVPLNTIFW
jgi:hypothetical protein